MSSASKADVHGISHDAEARVIRTLLWRLMPFLFLLYVVNYLDRINVGFAALQMQAQLGLSDRVYGLGAGIFFAGYFFFQVPSNLAMAHVGARRWMAAIMIIWGVISSSMIFVRTPHEFYTLRFLLGLAEAGFFPGIILYLKNWFPASARARAIALFMTAIPVSGVVGSPISGALLEVHGWHLAGWQWLFLIEGAPAILLGMATLALLVERPDSAAWLSSEQRNWLISELQREREIHPDATVHWSGAFLSPAVWLLTFVYCGVCTCMYGNIYFLPKLIRAVSNVSDFKVGLLSSVPFLTSAIAMFLVAAHSDRANERRWHLACAACTGALAAWLAAHVNSTPPTVLFLSIGLAGALAMMGPFWALSTRSLSQSTAPAGIALINSLGNLGGFIGPYVMGRLSATAGLRGGVVVVGAALLLSGGIAVLVREHRQTSSS